MRALLDDLLAQADYLRPHELLARILVRHDGRRRLIARLGPEAEDGIDALIDQALAYESVEAPSLTGFLGWFDREEVKVKRRTEEAADQVRVMTVHGAKGLEAPIVILPDTAVRNDGANPPQILRLATGQAVWKVPADLAPPAFAAAEAARRNLVREESRRLLYVGLTRAKSWLIVCGAGATAAAGSASGEAWHDLVREAMQPLGPGREPGPDGDILTLTHNWPAAPATGARARAPGRAAAARLGPPPRPPPGLRRRAPLSPSGLGGVHVLPGEPTFLLTEEEAKARGTAVHRLLEHLHGRPAADRPALAARLLPGTADLPGLLAEVEAVLDAPALAFLFAPGTLAEVDVTAPLAALGGGRILGRIDRLVVEPARVLAVDFKSHQAVPATPEAVPEGILRQMGAYHAALAADLARPPGGDRRPLDPRRPPDAAPRRLVAAALARAGEAPSPQRGGLAAGRRSAQPSAANGRHAWVSPSGPSASRPSSPLPAPGRRSGASSPARCSRRRSWLAVAVTPPDARHRRPANRSGSSSSPTSGASPASSSAPPPPRGRCSAGDRPASSAPAGSGRATSPLGVGRHRSPRRALRARHGPSRPRSGSCPGRLGGLAPIVLPAILVQTAAEELAFRGYLMQGLAARFRSRWVWWLLPAALFGALHWNPGEFGPNAWLVALSTGLIGLVLADVTVRTGNLSAAIGLHFANNVASLLVVSLPSPLAGLSLYLARIDPSDAAAVRLLLLADLATTLAAYAAWLALCHGAGDCIRRAAVLSRRTIATPPGARPG